MSHAIDVINGLNSTQMSTSKNRLPSQHIARKAKSERSDVLKTFSGKDLLQIYFYILHIIQEKRSTDISTKNAISLLLPCPDNSLRLSQVVTNRSRTRGNNYPGISFLKRATCNVGQRTNMSTMQQI